MLESRDNPNPDDSMMMDHKQDAELLHPHVLIFPYPAPGHVNPMLQLAELLCHAGGLHITFLTTDNIHDRLLRFNNIQSRFDGYPWFRFEIISDKSPGEQPRYGADGPIVLTSLRAKTKPLLKEWLIASRQSRESRRPPVTCIIADGVQSFALDVAEEMGIPVVYFHTASASAFWSYLCIPKLIEVGELPFKGNDLDLPIESIPGMEGFFRFRDLPSSDFSSTELQFVLSEIKQSGRAQGLIFNTFEDLEGPIISQVRTKMPNLYTIGPLHAHLKIKVTGQPTPSNSLREEGKSCIMWLDAQPSKSVIYVSFGTIATVKKEHMMELWHGLVNSGKRFLWVMRSDLVAGGDGENQIPVEVLEGTKDRGHVVSWAPQEEVLAHHAVGGFLTHSGWNSTLESIVAGVPMICWPCKGDQQLNSRFVGEVWKLGMDMKDTCDRVIVEKMVRDLIDASSDEFTQSANRMAELASKAVNRGGSSYANLDRLVTDIRSMSLQSQP